ncbi:MAG: MafI family immunity protein [Verrucomicrobiota bacterium]
MFLKHSKTIRQCEAAINSAKYVLSDEEYSESMDYILKHNEWLVGLEFAMDLIDEYERKITFDTYSEFEKAFSLMDLVPNKRLFRLKEQIEETEQSR